MADDQSKSGGIYDDSLVTGRCRNASRPMRFGPPLS
jgi:hypothetical protein